MLSSVVHQPNRVIIRRILHTSFIFIACFFILQQVQSQVRFYTAASETVVSSRQTFQIQYIIEGAKDIKQISIPRINGFKVEDNFDYPALNANQPAPDVYSRIIVLSPIRSGNFTIPGASAIVDGKVMQSNSLQVEVRQAGPGGSFNNTIEDLETETESELQPGEDINKKIARNLFLKVNASKTSCYVGEPLMVVYKVYSRLNANSQVVKRPSFTGFSVLEMVDSYDSKPEVEKLNGIYYYTNIIRKVQLFPLQEGSFNLDPAEIESLVKFVKVSDPATRRNEIRKLFNEPGTAPAPPSVVQYKTTLRTQPVAIAVKPLPADKQPEDFKGAVGKFTLSVRMPVKTVHKGDLVKIQVVINGSGNLSLLSPPAIQWPAGVDTADPVVLENFNKYSFPLTGSKTFEYSFAAIDTGNVEIPVIKLPYYDPADKTYKVASSDSMLLHVEPNLTRKEENVDAISEEDTSRIPRHIYWFAAVVIIILSWVIYQASFLRKKKVPVIKEVIIEPKKPTAAELLEPAKAALLQGIQPAFFNELQKVLWKVVAEACNVLPSALNKHNVASTLAAKGIEPFIIQSLVAVLDECEWTLYTPDQSPHDMQVLLSRAEEVLQQLLAA